MSKSDFIEAVAKEGKVSKADAKRAVELVFDTIAIGLGAGCACNLVESIGATIAIRIEERTRISPCTERVCN